MKFVELVVAVVALIGRMRDINLELTKRLAYLTRKRPRSETLERLERQLVLPLMGLAFVTTTASADARDSKKARRRSPRAGGRGTFPTWMERLRVVNPVTPEQRVCPICGGAMRIVGHSVCERFTVVPARILIEQRLDETVACPNDDTIVSASPPPAIVERGKLTDALIVEATCDKYLEHQPIERQCQRFARAGVDLAPQTLGRSVAAHLDLLAPVAQKIAEQTRAPGLLGTDATSIPILDPGVTEGIRNGGLCSPSSVPPCSPATTPSSAAPGAMSTADPRLTTFEHSSTSSALSYRRRVTRPPTAFGLRWREGGMGSGGGSRHAETRTRPVSHVPPLDRDRGS